RYFKIFSVIVFGFSASAFAAPDSVSYQGRLTDGGGNPLSGNFSLKFTIYDVPVGGVTLWTETQSAVAVSDGLFSVLLGDVTPLDESVFSSSPTFLGITVGSDGLEQIRLWGKSWGEILLHDKYGK
ncbi:MAG: hypothetical protein ACE5GA_10325, partial [Candidatus Zixiibacteriota bacterium]